jgi:hypothetical protein
MCLPRISSADIKKPLTTKKSDIDMPKKGTSYIQKPVKNEVKSSNPEVMMQHIMEGCQSNNVQMQPLLETANAPNNLQFNSNNVGISTMINFNNHSYQPAKQPPWITAPLIKTNPFESNNQSALDQSNNQWNSDLNFFQQPNQTYLKGPFHWPTNYN